MQELMDGIVLRFNASAGDALRGVVTDMFPDEAPESAVHPFITYALITSTSDYTMGPDGSDFDFPMIQFSIWDNKSYPDRVEAAAVLLKALYTDVLLSLASWWVIRADKIQERRSKEEGDKGYQKIVDYRYELQTSS